MWVVRWNTIFTRYSNVKRSWKINWTRWNMEKNVWRIKLGIYSDSLNIIDLVETGEFSKIIYFVSIGRYGLLYFDIDESLNVSIEKYKNEERFGMPSGHAQSIFFSIVYLYNLKHSIPLLFSNLFIASLTLYQRWKYRRHTVEQLASGSVIGGLFAWAVYSLEKYINK